MSEDFEDLVTTKSLLESATSRMSDCITDVNARLKQLGLGIEVWVPCDTAEFGYAKVDGEWSLAVRRNAIMHRLNDAPRAFRVEALLHFADLLYAMRNTSLEFHAVIDAAVSSAQKTMAENYERALAMNEVKPCYVRLVNGELLGRVEPCTEFYPLTTGPDQELMLLAKFRDCPEATLKLTARKNEKRIWEYVVEVEKP